MTNLLFFSGGEILVVGLAILLLFGAKSIPDIARMLGKGMNEFKRASDEIKRELRDQTSDVRNDLNETRTFVNDEISGIQQSVDADLAEDDPYQLAEGSDIIENQPEVTSTKRKKTTLESNPEQNAEGDDRVSRGEIIED